MVDTIKLNVGGVMFEILKDTLRKSVVLSELLDKNNDKDTIFLDENPNLFEHLLNRMRHADYVYPKDIDETMYNLDKFYKIKRNIISLGIGNAAIELTPKQSKYLTEKAKWYIDTCKDINKAFSRAMDQDHYTLKSIYNQGVDINYDLNAPYKSNMFYQSITANTVCSPEFLKILFKYGRKDIAKDGQHVFQMACSYGTMHHVMIFIERMGDSLDLYKGIYYAILNGNMENLHMLTMYYPVQKIKENQGELLPLAKNNKVLIYLMYYCAVRITKEILLTYLSDNFIDTFETVLKYYLYDIETTEKVGEIFEITPEILKNSLKTTDRFEKFDLMVKEGFKIDDLEALKLSDKEGKLQSPCIRRYTTHT